MMREQLQNMPTVTASALASGSCLGQKVLLAIYRANGELNLMPRRIVWDEKTKSGGIVANEKCVWVAALEQDNEHKPTDIQPNGRLAVIGELVGVDHSFKVVRLTSGHLALEVESKVVVAVV